MEAISRFPLQWRHNERDGVSDHQPHDCLLNRLFSADEKTSKLRVTGLCEGNSPVTGEFLALRASNAKNVSIWWRQHAPGPFLPKGGVAWRGVYVCFPNDDFVMSIPFSNDDAVGAFDFQTMIPSVYLLFKGRCSLWWFSNGDSVCTLGFLTTVHLLTDTASAYNKSHWICARVFMPFFVWSSRIDVIFLPAIFKVTSPTLGRVVRLARCQIQWSNPKEYG